MELNIKSIRDLRSLIIDELATISEVCRVHLDKNLLEKLIFKEIPAVTYYDDKLRAYSYGSAKIIAWSGPCLSKLDLSEVSFDNVIWDITRKEYKTIPIVQIDLSNTNANIDFSKSFDMVKPYYIDDNKEAVKIKIKKRPVELNGVNLSSTDLSNSSLNCVGKFIYTNISHSNASLDLELEENNEELEIINCNFEGIDLSSINLHPHYFIEYNKKEMPSAIKHITIRKTNFKNTKVNILPISTLDEKVFLTASVDPLKTFRQEITSERLLGCYYDGKKILSSPKLQETPVREKTEYEQFEEDVFNKIKEDIRNQAKIFSKK